MIKDIKAILFEIRIVALLSLYYAFMAKDGADVLNAYCDAGRQALENGHVRYNPKPHSCINNLVKYI